MFWLDYFFISVWSIACMVYLIPRQYMVLEHAEHRRQYKVKVCSRGLRRMSISAGAMSFLVSLVSILRIMSCLARALAIEEMVRATGRMAAHLACGEFCSQRQVVAMIPTQNAMTA